jgi:putative tricarboxylic transport membrane protein
MKNAAWRDRLTGIVLLVIAVTWSILSYLTIPADNAEAGAIGPRAFPLWLGIILAGLSVLMILRSLRSATSRQPTEERGVAQHCGLPAIVAACVFAAIVLYGYLMERLGFRLTTMLLVPVMLAGLLRIRQPVLILLFAAGMSLGCWLILHKLLGAYMPVGTWTSLS